MVLNTSDNTVAKDGGWFPPLTTDPWAHHVNGEALWGGSFGMPLISEIAPGLFQGGCINGLNLRDGVDAVISLYPWERYRTNGTTYTYEMYDGNFVDESQVESAADMAESYLEVGGRVLIHCQAGLNRSSLVTATVLMRQGMSADEAISTIRAKRSPTCLCNSTFEDWLRNRWFSRS